MKVRGDFVSLATHDDLASADQVLELAGTIAEKGGRPGVGLMAIPLSWAARFSRQPVDLLDACTNVSIGTAMMASFAADCSHRARGHDRRRTSRRDTRRQLEAVRSCVLQGFDQEIGVRGFTLILSEVPHLPVRDPDLDLPAERSNVFNADAPTVRPQIPLEPPGALNAGTSEQAPPASLPRIRSMPGAAPNPPRGSGSPRARAPPANPPAPIGRPPGATGGKRPAVSDPNGSAK